MSQLLLVMRPASTGHLIKRVKSMNEINHVIKKKRQNYAPEFKAETLKLTKKASVTIAIKELRLKESQIYT